MGRAKEDSNFFVTFILIFVLILLRVCSDYTDFTVSVLAVINILMLSYIFYNINKKAIGALKERKNKSKIFLRQFHEYCRWRNVFVVIIILVCFIYVFLTYISNNPKICGLINDSISFLAFGLSVEEDEVTHRIVEFFKGKDFNHEKEKKK